MASEPWDDRYRDADPSAARAAQVLTENLHLLPRFGRALDLACGLGGNALLLASQGLETSAWDRSMVAVSRLAEHAETLGVPLAAEVRDLSSAPPAPASFDVIVVSRFLDRALCPAIAAALRPGGLLFYQTFTRLRAGAAGPRNPDFLLDEGELLTLFSGLRPLVYRDEGLAGDLARGLRGEALLVARRPPVHGDD